MDAGLSKSKKKGKGWYFSLGFFLIFAVLLLTSWSATQLIAYQFDYHKNLGDSLYGRIYWPWEAVFWSVQFYQKYPQEFTQAYQFSLAFGVITFGLGVLLFSLLKRRPMAVEGLHGSAHFADEKEVRETGLLPPNGESGKGVYVGAWEDKKAKETMYLRHDGKEHVLAFAPTRSGKGVGLVLPTLLSWPASVVVLDIKGENWALTSGWRQKHADNLVMKFDPAAVDGSSVKFNPLEEIRLETDHEVADVQNIVSMIVDPDGKGLNDHWAKTGHALLVGTVLHLLYKAKKEGFRATLKGVAEFLSDPTTPIEAVYTEMMEYEHLGSGETHPVVASSARDMLNKAENERSGVLSTAMSFLTLYRDPIVAANTEYSEFRIRDLMNHDKPVSLYLVVNPNDMDRLKPLVRLTINQIMRTLTEKMDFKDGSSVAHYKHRLLLLIDEFPSLGRLEIFQQSLAFIAGYGLKAYLIIQDLAQLYAAYGRDESIVSNCHIRAAFAPNKIETAKLLSEMAGTTTVITKKRSTSGKRFSAVLGNVTENYQEVSRPLLTPDECMRLPAATKTSDGQIKEAGDMLIFSAGHAPIYGKQILYFKDPVFNARSKVEAPLQSDAIATVQSSKVSTTSSSTANSGNLFSLDSTRATPEPDVTEPEVKRKNLSFELERMH